MTGPRLSDEERLVAKKRKADKQRERQKNGSLSIVNKRYYEKNKDKILERAKIYQHKHRDIISARAKTRNKRLYIPIAVNNTKIKTISLLTIDELIIFANEILDTYCNDNHTS